MEPLRFEYDPACYQRRIPEGPKKAYRSDFERDLARVEHSHGLRRLSDVTQVFQADGLRRVRNRYSHSVEVANIGRFMARQLGADPDLVAGAGLSHDLGHPPFGHHGESVLNALSGDFGGFEGNAQTFRVLTRLEPKLVQDGLGYGINPTRAFLDGVMKYPWRRGEQPTSKYGYYVDDAEAFAWLREGAPPNRACAEAQLMDWADDVAYSTHDIEDGIIAGLIDVEKLWLEDERAALCGATATRRPDILPADIARGYDRILALPQLEQLRATSSASSALQALAILKKLTSELIDRFVGSVVQATRAAHGERAIGRYAGELVVPAERRAEVEVLKSITWRYLLESDRFVAQRIREADVLKVVTTDLLDAAARGGAGARHHAPITSLDDKIIAALWEIALAAPDMQRRARAVLDTVAALTDQALFRMAGATL